MWGCCVCVCLLQTGFKGALDDLLAAVSHAAGSVADAAASLSKQHRPASPLQQRATHHQQALLSTPPAGVNAAKQQLSSSLSVLHSAVAAAVLSSAAECDQSALLGREVEQPQAQLRQAAAGHQELQGQLCSLQQELANADRKADAVRMQLQEVGAQGLLTTAPAAVVSRLPAHACASWCHVCQARQGPHAPHSSWCQPLGAWEH